MDEGQVHVPLKLHYLAWGATTDPGVVLLHGGSAHAYWWEPVAPVLADGRRVVALDLRGHGDSAWADPPTYDAEDYARDIVAAADALGLTTLVLVGHSLGGIVAAFAAARLGDRVRALVVIDSRTKVVSGRTGTMQRLGALPHPTYRSREEGIARYRLLPVGPCQRPDLLARMAEHALRPDGAGGWTFKFDRAVLSAVRPRDIRPLLADLRCPILAVRGSESPMMPAKATEAMAAVAPQLETVEISGAHHHVMLDRPVELARVLHGFLERACPIPRAARS